MKMNRVETCGWRERFVRLAAGSATLLLVATGCNHSQEEASPQVALGALSKPAASDAIHVGRGAPPVAIRWIDSGSSEGNTLRVDVENTTGASISAQLELVAKGPRGAEASVTQGRRNLQAHSSARLNIPIARVPIQSTGESSAVTLVVTYHVDRSGVPELPEGFSVRNELKAYSDVRYITFEEDFTSAAIRNSEVQSEHNRGRSAAADVVVRSASVARVIAGKPGDPDRPILRIGGAPSATPTTTSLPTPTN